MAAGEDGAICTENAAMSINPVLFEQCLSMIKFMQLYDTKAKAYHALYCSRWAQGFRGRVSPHLSGGHQ